MDTVRVLFNDIYALDGAWGAFVYSVVTRRVMSNKPCWYLHTETLQEEGVNQGINPSYVMGLLDVAAFMSKNGVNYVIPYPQPDSMTHVYWHTLGCTLLLRAYHKANKSPSPMTVSSGTVSEWNRYVLTRLHTAYMHIRHSMETSGSFDTVHGFLTRPHNQEACAIEITGNLATGKHKFASLFGDTKLITPRDLGNYEGITADSQLSMDLCAVQDTHAKSLIVVKGYIEQAWMKPLRRCLFEELYTSPVFLAHSVYNAINELDAVYYVCKSLVLRGHSFISEIMLNNINRRQRVIAILDSNVIANVTRLRARGDIYYSALPFLHMTTVLLYMFLAKLSPAVCIYDYATFKDSAQMQTKVMGLVQKALAASTDKCNDNCRLCNSQLTRPHQYTTAPRIPGAANAGVAVWLDI